MRNIIREYLDQIADILQEFDTGNIATMIEFMEKARVRNKNIFVLGNGGSAATVNHFVCDLGKNAIEGDVGRFKIISLCDNIETLTAFGNDLGYEHVFEERLKNLMNPGDLLIAVSASGNSENVLCAVQYAKAKKGTILSLTGAAGGKLKALSDYNIAIDSVITEQIEDLHLIIEHSIVTVYKYKNTVCGAGFDVEKDDFIYH
jgi:D-sedoheptulose 7-phosphate isomerase